MLPQDIVLRFTLGMSAMFTFYWFISHVVLRPISRRRAFSRTAKKLCSLLILYLPGLGLLYLFIKDLPMQKLTGLTYGFKDFGIIFLAQNAVIIVIAVITLIEAKVSKKELKKIDEDTIYDSTLDVALLLLAIPLLEEFVTRKLLADRAGGEHLWLFLLLSALTFSLIHLQTGRIAVAVGMLYSGFLWALIYAASQSLWLSTLYHVANNVLLTFLPEQIKKKVSDKVHNVYIAVIALSGVVGIVLFLMNSSRLLPSTQGLSTHIRRVFMNPGTWLLIAVCMGSFALAVLKRSRERRIKSY